MTSLVETVMWAIEILGREGRRDAEISVWVRKGEKDACRTDSRTAGIAAWCGKLSDVELEERKW